MNITIEKQLKHRTIRKFKDKKVDKSILKLLSEVSNHTATSVGMQSYSIIRITDIEKKESISKICNQDYIKDIPELLIFIVDIFRNSQIAKEQGEAILNKNTMDKFFQGFTDGAIACQNMVVAIESLELGAVYLGGILNDPGAIIELLGLPKLTFPIVGLGFGYPDQTPQLKPRMNIELKIFENVYDIKDNYMALIEDYDSTMKAYYTSRGDAKELDKFSQQVIFQLNRENTKRSKILNEIEKQGFNLKVKC